MKRYNRIIGIILCFVFMYNMNIQILAARTEGNDNDNASYHVSEKATQSEKDFAIQNTSVGNFLSDSNTSDLTIQFSGTIGDVYWNIYTNGLLEVYGEGAIIKDSTGYTPWHKYHNYITSILVRDTITSICRAAFADCVNVTDITLPFVGESRTAIGYKAQFGYVFWNYTEKEYANRTYFDEEGFAIGYGYYAGKYSKDLYYYYTFDIPQRLKNVYVTDAVKIEKAAFQNCRYIDRIIINDGVISLGDCAFYLTNIKEFIIPESVSSIGDYTFGYCDFSNIVLPQNVKTIGSYAFERCLSLKEITLHDGITMIGDHAFYECEALERISIGMGIKTIPAYAFAYCKSLSNVTVPESVQRIEGFAFIGCENITDITLPFVGESRTAEGYAGQFGFIFGYYTSKTCYASVFDNGKNKDSFAKGYGFYYSAYNSSSYYYYNFCNPTSITTVTITDATKLAKGAFHNCTKITNIVLNDGIESIGDYAFYNTPWYQNQTDEFVTVGDNVLIKYNGKQENIAIPKGVKSIAGGVFKNKTSISSITLQEGLKRIGESAFEGCTKMTELTVPRSVVSIGKNAIPSSCGISVYCPSAGYNYRSENRTVLNSSYSSGNETYYYGVNDDGYAEIIGCTTTSESVTVPTEIDGITVNKIGDYGFINCTSLKSITIPNSISIIGNYAFSECNNIVNITIPATVKSIGEYAFNNCSKLTHATISEGVERIGKGAFYNCTSLIEAVIPDSIISIGAYAFYNCTAITIATIGTNSKEIGDFTFYNCFNLDTVVIGMAVESIGDYAFYGCSIGRVTIPTSTTSIGKCAFAENAKLTRVTLRKNLLTIGEGAFKNDKLLATISIPATVTEIGKGAFENCESITKIVVPEGVTVLNDYVFSNCKSLSDITINENITYIGTSALYNTSIYDFTVPNTTKQIREWAFNSCKNLSAVSIPDGVETIGFNAFSKCADLTLFVRYQNGSLADDLLCNQGMSYVILAPTICSIGDRTFASCRELKSISYGDEYSREGEYKFSTYVADIGQEVFKNNTNLQSLVVPDTIQSIGDDSFADTNRVTVSIYFIKGTISEGLLDAQNIVGVIIDDNIQTISDSAFSSCPTLEMVSIPDTIASVGSDVFMGSSENMTLAIRGVDGTIDDSVLDGKTNGIVNVNLDDNIEVIGNYAFANGNTITGVAVGSGVRRIGDYAFYECKNIIEMNLPETVREIGSYAFYDCNSLKNINIPNGVEVINTHTFFGCTSLCEAMIPTTVESIGDYAYYGCVSINNLSLGNSIKTIGNYAFYNCNQVKEIKLPETLTSIGNYAFRSCSQISEITIPDKVTSLGDCIFYGCIRLKQAEFGMGITSIGDSVFYACTDMNKLVLFGNVDYIHDLAFYGAEDTIVYAFGNDYVEEYCYDMGIEYYDLGQACSMDIIKLPKLDYYEYDELDLSGMELELTYDSGIKRVVKTGYQVSGFDSTKVGNQTLNVNYKGQIASFDIIINEKQIKCISVSSGIPETIIVGEKIDWSKVVLSVTFEDNSSVELTKGYEVGEFNNESLGEQEIVISYRNARTSVIISVIEEVSPCPSPSTTPTAEPTTKPTAEPTSKPTATPEPEKEIRYLSIAHKSNRLWYYLGEELETDGIAVRVFYTDMTDEIIALEDCDEIQVTGPDINLTGGQYVYVSYKGWEARFSVRYGGRADVRGIRIKTKPTKLLYKQGERLDASGIVVKALSQDLAETFEIPVEELVFKSFRNDEAGLVTVRVFYMDYYDTGFTARVSNEKLLASVNSTKPAKVTYQVGEAFDPTGMVVTAKYYDNTTEEIPLSKVTITGFDSESAGIKLVTISYGGMTKSFSVRVI